MDWQTVTRHTSALGESPFWHPQQRQLYWVDIPGFKIMRTDPLIGSVQCWHMPMEPGCIAPAALGGLVIALRDGIYRAQDWEGDLQLVYRFEHDTCTTRFNDGKADPLGRFWAGTMYEPRDAALGQLFAIDCRDARAPLVQRMSGGATVANGLAWSPDGRCVYWCDTTRSVIRAWDWDGSSNTMRNERIFKRFAPAPAPGTRATDAYVGRPDGAAVDVNGNYYVAMFEGQRLLKLAPDGSILEDIPTPTACPTMPCFGGDDHRTLFITTARHLRPEQELARQPGAGCVFSTRVDVPGLPVNFYYD